MEQGTAILISALISTILGGSIGFFSSYLTHRLNVKQNEFLNILPKQLDAIETNALMLFKLMSGERLSEEYWNIYIKNSYWLPVTLRDNCLVVLDNKENTKLIKVAHSSLLDHINSHLKS